MCPKCSLGAICDPQSKGCRNSALGLSFCYSKLMQIWPVQHRWLMENVKYNRNYLSFYNQSFIISRTTYIQIILLKSWLLCTQISFFPNLLNLASYRNVISIKAILKESDQNYALILRINLVKQSQNNLKSRCLSFNTANVQNHFYILDTQWNISLTSNKLVYFSCLILDFIDSVILAHMTNSLNTSELKCRGNFALLQCVPI